MSSTRIFIKLLTVTATIFITNCSVPPESIIKLDPESEQSDWYKGKEIAILTNDSITIRISYDRNINHNYIFDTDITNHMQNPVLVEPEKFYYEPNKEKSKQGEKLSHVNAKDPELVILDLQRSFSLHRSNVETQSMFYSLGYFIQFVGQTKALVTNDQELSNRIEHQTNKLEQDKLINEVKNRNVSEALSASLDLWEVLALRKTTLYKNESISGKVFFPANKFASTLEVHFPIDNYELKINYNQTIINP